MNFLTLLQCTCPAGTNLETINIPTCLEDFGQIQKLIFQRRKNGSTINSFTIASSNPNLLASWTPLLTAADSTKAVVTPYVEDMTSEPGEPITFGGGNQTLNGVERIVGKNPTAMSGVFYSMPAEVMEDMDNLACEDVSVFLVNEHGQIAGLNDDNASPTIFKGIPVQPRTLFIGDKSFGGKDEPDRHAIQFFFGPNWSKNFHVVDPTDFDATQDLDQ